MKEIPPTIWWNIVVALRLAVIPEAKHIIDKISKNIAISPPPRLMRLILETSYSPRGILANKKGNSQNELPAMVIFTGLGLYRWGSIISGI